jgi:hemerythrin-like domain-containing protein
MKEATMTARRSRRLPKGVLIPLVAAGLAAAALRARRRTERSRDSGGMTDVGYMRAIHDALRRDMAHLESVTRTVDATASPPAALTEGWTEFRGWLDRHHRAEDDDLWPVLRRHLNAPGDQHEVDAMVEEHQTLTATVDDVDAALAHQTGLATAVDALGPALREHLEHEERSVLPLLERHLSRAEWRAFLLTERRRTPLRDRPEFLAWVLDDASKPNADTVLSELPPPGRLVYRYLLRPRYRARHRWES